MSENQLSENQLGFPPIPTSAAYLGSAIIIGHTTLTSHDSAG